MIPESPLARTEHGLIPQEDGWFVLNARDSTWLHGPGRSAICDFEGDVIDFHQLGINITVLEPGVQMAMYHWEADQEDFLVSIRRGTARRRGRGAPVARVGLRALPGRDEARARRRR